MTNIISFINQKGGCGKSTTCVHFVKWSVQCGIKVVLVDADAQKSSSTWVTYLDIGVHTEIIQSPDELLDRIPEISKQCDLVVVDGAAGLSESSRAILFRSKLTIVPCQPTGVDLHSASEAVRLIKQAQSVRSGQPNAVTFISRATKGTKLLNEARSLMSKSGIKLLNTTIYQRQVVADTFGQSATVWDIQSRAASQSAREYDRLFQEITNEL